LHDLVKAGSHGPLAGKPWQLGPITPDRQL